MLDQAKPFAKIREKISCQFRAQLKFSLVLLENRLM
jgi:hypothetical protein